jgi:hypothetical protein
MRHCVRVLRRVASAAGAIIEHGQIDSIRYMTAHRIDKGPLAGMGWRERRRLLAWLMLSVLAALLAYFGFRGYLNPELLFHFANALTC